jgi:hypothetical protein
MACDCALADGTTQSMQTRVSKVKHCRIRRSVRFMVIRKPPDKNMNANGDHEECNGVAQGGLHGISQRFIELERTQVNA